MEFWRRERWWPGTGSNRRRRPFQGRALPLSYLALAWGACSGQPSVTRGESRTSAHNCISAGSSVVSSITIHSIDRQTKAQPRPAALRGETSLRNLAPQYSALRVLPDHAARYAECR
jgi:hypothetical protein